MEALRPFSRRASARVEPAHYVRIRVGTARGKAQKVGDNITCSAMDPAQLTAELAERIADLDPSDGKAFVECLAHNSSDVVESVVIDLATDAAAVGSTQDQVILGALGILKQTNTELREFVADAYGSVNAAQERSARAQDQRDTAARVLFEERLAFERERAGAGIDKPAPMSPTTEKLFLLGASILGHKLLGGPVPKVDLAGVPPLVDGMSTEAAAKAKEQAEANPKPPDDGPTPVQLAEALDEALDVVAYTVGKLPALLNQVRARKLATCLGLPPQYVDLAVAAATP